MRHIGGEIFYVADALRAMAHVADGEEELEQNLDVDDEAFTSWLDGRRTLKTKGDHVAWLECRQARKGENDG